MRNDDDAIGEGYSSMVSATAISKHSELCRKIQMQEDRSCAKTNAKLSGSSHQPGQELSRREIES